MLTVRIFSTIMSFSANLLFQNILVGEKGGKEGAKKDSKGDEDETASVTSYESSMVSGSQ